MEPDDTDPLLDPKFGLDAPTNVARDDLLATVGLLRVLANILEEEVAIAPGVIRKLAMSMQMSSLPQHQFGPTEQNLDDHQFRLKLRDNLRSLVDEFGEVINGDGRASKK
ncbi:hypothetical protein [Herbiconiux liukaitaii]|uniref:hypothetical protein n=1 Tax=Herbiconiux liukaitaii TaxID=3342799 RepID=UPI0035B97FBF